jgi:hypothetical protein
MTSAGLRLLCVTLSLSVNYASLYGREVPVKVECEMLQNSLQART